MPSNVATRLRLPSNQGLLVRGVDPAGPAASSGIAPGDVLVEAARQPLRAVSDLTAVLGKSTGKPVALLVNRNGVIVFANAPCASMFGYGVAELVGQYIELIVPEYIRNKHANLRNRYFESPHSRPMGIGLDLVAADDRGAFQFQRTRDRRPRRS